MSMVKSDIIQPIPAEVLTQVLQNITDANAALAPYLISLTPYDRKALYKVSDGTDPFVDKGVVYAAQYPQFVPQQLDVEAMNADYEVKTELQPLITVTTGFLSLLNDTHMLAGAEALQGVLSYYNSVKQASRENVANAKDVYNDMKKRYARTKKKETPTEKETVADTAIQVA